MKEKSSFFLKTNKETKYFLYLTEAPKFYFLYFLPECGLWGQMWGQILTSSLGSRFTFAS